MEREKKGRRRTRTAGSVRDSLYVAIDRTKSREIEFVRTYDTQEREERSCARSAAASRRAGGTRNKNEREEDGRSNDQNALDPSATIRRPETRDPRLPR